MSTHAATRPRSWPLVALLASLSASSLGCSSASEPSDPPRPHVTSPHETSPHETSPHETSPSAVEPEAPDAPLVQGERAIMSTIYRISVVGEESPEAHAAIERAFDEIARLEDVLSEWRDTSEVSAINRAAGGAPVHVGPETLTIVEAGLRASERTDGAFDLTWAAMRGLYLFQPGHERVPSDAEIAERLPLVGYRDLVVDHAASTVSLRRAGMAIGTGGIAKGYALDRAQALLIEAGYPDFMIFGGGQVQLHGTRGGRPWRVGIQHPRRDDYIAFFEATDAAIATSGDYEHAFIDDEGRRWHHIIDLRTGRPAAESVQVTVLAPSGIDADAMSTACFVLGPERCVSVFSGLEGYEAVIVGADMRVHMTPGARDRVHLRAPLEGGRIPM